MHRLSQRVSDTRYPPLHVSGVDVYTAGRAANKWLGRAVREVAGYFRGPESDDEPESGLPGREHRAAPSRLLISAEMPVPRIPGGAQDLAQTPEGVRIYRHDEQLYLRLKGALLHLDMREGSGILVLPGNDPSAAGGLLFGLVFYALVLLLQRRGLYAMHAAAVALDGQGVLVLGESGSGKSTLAMRLASSGWDVLSDDSVVVGRVEGAVKAYPLRQDFCLLPDAGRLFPAAAEHWSAHVGDPEKKRVRVGAMYPGQVASSCTPSVLLFPEITHEERSRIVPLGRAEAMRGLMRHAGALGVASPLDAERHLSLLRDLAGQTSAYRLLAGRDLLSEAEPIGRLGELVASSAHV